MRTVQLPEDVTFAETARAITKYLRSKQKEDVLIIGKDVQIEIRKT